LHPEGGKKKKGGTRGLEDKQFSAYLPDGEKDSQQPKKKWVGVLPKRREKKNWAAYKKKRTKGNWVMAG